MTEDFKAGMKQGGALFGSTLIEMIEEEESQGATLSSEDYKAAIRNLIEILDKPKIILNS